MTYWLYILLLIRCGCVWMLVGMLARMDAVIDYHTGTATCFLYRMLLPAATAARRVDYKVILFRTAVPPIRPSFSASGARNHQEVQGRSSPPTKPFPNQPPIQSRSLDICSKCGDREVYLPPRWPGRPQSYHCSKTRTLRTKFSALPRSNPRTRNVRARTSVAHPVIEPNFKYRASLPPLSRWILNYKRCILEALAREMKHHDKLSQRG